MKLTMAEAGCSGSNSANRWHTFSAKLPGFLATKPKTLQRGRMRKKEMKKRYEVCERKEEGAEEESEGEVKERKGVKDIG